MKTKEIRKRKRKFHILFGAEDDSRESPAKDASTSTTPLSRNQTPRIPLALAYPVHSTKAVMHNRRANQKHAHKSEEIVHPSSIPQSPPWTDKPLLSAGEDYLNRFKKNAFLVASGVARNVNSVCNHIKESSDDILDPYRIRPK